MLMKELVSCSQLHWHFKEQVFCSSLNFYDEKYSTVTLFPGERRNKFKNRSLIVKNMTKCI